MRTSLRRTTRKSISERCSEWRPARSAALRKSDALCSRDDASRCAQSPLVSVLVVAQMTWRTTSGEAASDRTVPHDRGADALLDARNSHALLLTHRALCCGQEAMNEVRAAHAARSQLTCRRSRFCS